VKKSKGVCGMNERMKHLLPNDRYTIQLYRPCKDDYCIALTHLYQPLIGLEAVSLYLTLLNDTKFSDGPSTHHTIMSMTSMNLDHFYQARLKLEAIGLLKTFVQDEDSRTFFYVLQPPFSIEEFFNDSMLAILLEHHVGDGHFQRLKGNLCKDTMYPNGATEMTKSFNEVFQTMNPNVQPKAKPKSQDSKKTETHNEDQLVDFEWMEEAIKKNGIVPSKILTNSNKVFIYNLAKIYQVDNLTLEKAILWSISEDHELLKQELQDACKDYYVKHFNRPAPKLIAKQTIQPASKSTNNEPKSKEDKLIEHFDQITHRELLEDYSQSGVASESEVTMLTNIMFQHGLSQSVMNVLVHYVLQKSDMKLTRNYVEKIATHWARKKVINAKQAMELAKSESRLYRSWGSKKTTSKSKEVLPDWFKNQDKSEKTNQQNQQNKQDQNRDIMKEKMELEKALRKVSSKL
jgi:replication initiation and membrane attachment protein